jgi:hypothetical protein
VAHVAGKAQATERLGDPPGTAPLTPVLPHVAAGFRAAVEQYPRTPRLVVDGPLPGGGRNGDGALALPVEQGGTEGQVADAVEGEKRDSLLLRVTKSRSH